MEDNHKNIMTAGIFLIVIITAILLSGDILKSLSLSILAAIVTEMALSKYKKGEYHDLQMATENKINTKPIADNEKIVNWKAIFTGLAVSGILLIILLFTPPPDGVTEMSEETSNLFTSLIMGAVFIGGVITGYMSYFDESGLINSIIFAAILGLLVAILSPLMVLFVMPGPVGGIMGIMIKKI